MSDNTALQNDVAEQAEAAERKTVRILSVNVRIEDETVSTAGLIARASELGELQSVSIYKQNEFGDLPY